ncbi:MAG: prolipoprotein diacylglyceryl transferase [Candidatus Omnitrophota bacterium]|jgi:phosphatidylglycerol:prolipoprotein diacylglycerol transferase|nr:MAG: prolipoprotein diacylglyceryl transferase [Candidatus Omnitrophota bacterium]
MHPVICRIGPFSIYSYGLMLVLGFLVASLLARRQAKNAGIDPDLISNLIFYIFISGILGARIFYVVENADFYFKNPAEIIMLQHGGLSWFGGLILGSACGIFYLKRRRQSVLKILDLLSPFVALAQSIGRIGCLLNGCCFGKPSVYGFYFPAHEDYLIPTQLYSSVVLLFIYFLLRAVQIKKRDYSGEVFFLYLFLYSISRFIIEFFRADNPVIVFGLTLFQLISLLLFVISSLFLIRIKIRQ